MARETVTNHDDLIGKLPPEELPGFLALDDDGGHISIKPEQAEQTVIKSPLLDPTLVQLYQTEDDGGPVLN